jgi:uncharacterized membrane protein YciS (DUF1049 family)
MMRSIATLIRYALLTLLVIVSVSFAVGNQHDIALSFPPSTTVLHIPIYLFGGCVFAMGIASGLLSSMMHYNRKMVTLRRQLKQNVKISQALEQELHSQQAETIARTRMRQAVSPLLSAKS